MAQQDWFVVAEPVEPMWYVLDHLMGFQNALPLIAEQPDLLADILNTYTDFLLGMCQLCVERGITLRNGAYVYHSDHSIPPTVSFARYAQIVELVSRYGRYE